MLLTSLTLCGAALAGGWAASGLIGAAAEGEHPADGAFVPVDGGRLHYAESGAVDGTRPALLLLHGASSNHADLFSVLAPRLKGHIRILAFDRPGQGWSDRLGGREMASPARQAAAVIEALRILGVSRVVIAAHSLAGPMALTMGLERPDLVAGIVLIGAVSHPWPGREITWYYHPASHPLVGPLFVRTAAIPAAPLAMENALAGVFAPQPVPEGYARTSRISLVFRPAAFEANAQDVAGIYDYVDAQWPRYASLAMPVTAIAGEEDEVVWTDVHSRAVAREAPHGRLFVLPGVGHMPHHAAPDLIAAEIKRLMG
jgi:pimeloyl-ACP methyl ester carboxylesterase